MSTFLSVWFGNIIDNVIGVTETPMEPVEEPVEDKTVWLPKNCYFNDGRSKVDYVMVYPVLPERIRGDTRQTQIDRFIAALKEKGLLVESEPGKFFSTLTFVKIHAPHKVLVRYAKIFNIELTCNNPYYKYEESMPRFFATELTKPCSDSDIYQRAPITLSGKRPTEVTAAERSLIVFKMINMIQVIFNNEEIGLRSMLQRETFLDAYPIHDGDYRWTETGFLSDRQLLFRYWANFRYIFKEQPVHLLEKYYGPKVAFCFAFKSFCTKMLMVPTLIGLISALAGAVYLAVEGSYINEEVCKSDVVLCHDQHMKSSCGLMKLAYFVDNPMTVAYVILCCFWGAIFWNLWQRRQAMLRLRWNLTHIRVDRTMRREFQETAKTRKSSITGEIEYYIPPSRKVMYFVLSTFTICVLVVFFVFLVNLVVHYRFWLMKNLRYDSTNNPNIIEVFTSSGLTTLLIIALSYITPFFLRSYSKFTQCLTKLQVPRTQLQYKRMFLHKLFIIQFMNVFIPFFYLAFFKGFFHTHPGNTSRIVFIRNIQLDLCKPSGCLIDLGVQLAVFLVIDSVFRQVLEVIKATITPWTTVKISKETKESMGQWEKDYLLNQLDQSDVDGLYSELVFQYCFITFFNAALPIVGLILVINNLLKTQMDAYRFVKLYRRPIMEKVPDIEGWNEILKVITFFGAISNSFVIAFRNDFILRVLYRNQHDGSLKGFINSTLSKFALEDYPSDLISDINNATYCYYRGLRYPPDHPKKYQPTTEYWYVFAIRALVFMVLENFTLILSMMLGYVIPEIPRKVKVKLEHDAKMLKEAKEAQLEREIK